MKLLAALVLAVLLAGCVREQEVSSVYYVFLPAIQHDCSWIVRHQEYVDAVAACDARKTGTLRMPNDCATPEPQDYCR